MTSLIASPRLSRTEFRQQIDQERARRHLLHFTNFTYPHYIAEPVHALIASALDQVVAGEIKRLMIFAPPQTGKSELVSVRLPAFWLAHRPDDPVILATYGADLSYSKSRQARDIVEGADFADLFPGVTTRPDSRAVHHWEIAGFRGGLLAAGVGGPITGHGALLGLIDDPIENWEQAQSPTIREQVWNWWRSTFRTRVWEGGSIVLIMTRWHEDDLAGRILQEQADKWTVLRLPALAETQADRDQNNQYLGLPPGQPDPLGREPGEALCPKRFSQPALIDIQSDVGSLVWGAEYQGVPRALEGNRFKRSWFPIVEAAPAQARRVRYWDKAGTEGGGAATAGVLVAYAADRLIYIEDVVTGHWSAGQREAVIKQTAQLDRERFGQIDTWIEQEPGSGGKESAESTVKNLAGFRIYADKVTGDKDVRLEPFAAQAEAGNARVVRGMWNGLYIEELCALPNGKYRDQADATAGAFNKLTGAPGKIAFGSNPFYGEG
jgi:predicted phage terminase large subunit-like protein